MRHRFAFVVLAASALGFAAVPAQAANHYIRAGATGSATGADWTNAFTKLPASLTRGDTYYIADGSYPGYTFSTPTSGTTLITVKKATPADHGTATGWSDSFGAGTASFTNQFVFTSAYWWIDGMVGGGPATTKAGWTTGYGFKVTETSSSPVLFVKGPSLSGQGGNVTLRHIEAQGAGNNGAPGGTGNDAVQVYEPTGPTTISYAYLHDVGRCITYIRNTSSTLVTFEYVFTGQYESTSAEHSELMVLHGPSYAVFRWSIVTHEEGTGAFISGDDSQNANLEFYGNVVYDSQAFGQWDTGNNGFFASDSAGTAANWKIFNNTFISVPSAETVYDGNKFTGTNLVQNNYYYLCAGNPSGFTESFDHWQDSGAAHGTSGTTGSGNPFVNLTGYDFRLVAASPAGTSLPAPYNVDMFGNTRGADGKWDKGAIEFGGGAVTTAPGAPTNVRIIP
jgi:hypothetical protein